jgi:hypothetical protein
MGRPKKNPTVAQAAAAAAAAAVRAQQDENSRLTLNWSDDPDEEQERLASDVLEDLEQIDEAQGGQVAWELYCDTPLEKAGQIRKLARSELRNLRDECLALGPGQYHVVAREPMGKFVKGSRRNIKISGFARPTAPAGPVGFDPMTFMAQLEERAERRRSDERRERWDTIKFWAPFLSPIAIEMAKGLFGRGGSEPMKDIVAALVGLKALSGEGNGSEKAIETLLKGIELARDLNPGDSKGATWPDVLVNGVTTVVKEFRPLAESLAARRNGATPAATPPAQLQFQTAPQAPGTLQGPASATPPPEGGQDTAMWAIVEPLLRKAALELEDFATNGADPELAADAVYAKIPRLIKSQLQPQQMKDLLMQPNWWQITVGFHPPLQPYQGFCDDVRLALLDIAEEQLNPSQSTPDDAQND